MGPGGLGGSYRPGVTFARASVVSTYTSPLSSGATSGIVPGVRPPLVGLGGGWRSGEVKLSPISYGYPTLYQSQSR